ncbi:hypothetical protein DMB37_39795 [Nocardia sp. CS682]|nr:hypothetical protein DMB37_39795 [Nocardia sp. CS682]
MNLCREFRRHVDHDLTVVDQPVCGMAADTVAPFDRPYSLGVSRCGGGHFGVSGVVGAVSARVQHGAGGVDDLDRG